MTARRSSGSAKSTTFSPADRYRSFLRAIGCTDGRIGQHRGAPWNRLTEPCRARRGEAMQKNAQDPLATVLDAGETVQVVAFARQARVVVTDRRVAVADEERVAMHVPY